MSAQQEEIMKNLQKTLQPINEAVNEMAYATETPDGDTDPLIIRAQAIAHGVGRLAESLSVVGGKYHMVQNRDQFATSLIYVGDSLLAFQLGAATREAAAANAASHESFIDSVINSPDEEAPVSSSHQIAVGHIDELEKQLAESLKAAAGLGDDIYLAIAQKLINTVKLGHDTLQVTSMISDVVCGISSNKATQEKAMASQAAAVTTTCLSNKVVNIKIRAKA